MPALLEDPARCRQPQTPPHLREVQRRAGIGQWRGPLADRQADQRRSLVQLCRAGSCSTLGQGDIGIPDIPGSHKAAAIRRAVRAGVPGCAFTPRTVPTPQASGRSWPGSDTCRERQRTAAEKPAEKGTAACLTCSQRRTANTAPETRAMFRLEAGCSGLRRPGRVCLCQLQHQGPHSFLAGSHLYLAADE